MDFRLLGPLEVSEGADPLPLGGPRQRSLLALLLTRANEVVPTDRLIDELWGEEASERGINALQAAVSRLRRALVLDRGRPRVVTRRNGYVLEIAPEELDVRRFERLVGEGRRALSAGAPGVAAEKLREALLLWRGPALADFLYEPFAQPEIARLEELRLLALEERIEADLALARHAELVGELESLIARHPLRERLRRQLMLALFRSGRQADALAAYQGARRVLVEELGIEPSAELRELEAAILRQDSALAVPAPVAAPATVAHNLPSQATSFVGRWQERAELLRLLSETRLLTLTGPGGGGKSRLALEVAAELIGEFADGVWLVELASVSDPRLVPQALASALGVREEPGRPLVETVTDDLAVKEILLVIDNCEHLIRACAEVVGAVLRACPRARVLVTSQASLGIAGEQLFCLSPLALPDPATERDVQAAAGFDAVRLFVARAVATNPGFAPDPSALAAVVAVCRRLDGLPLAIELAAARTRALSVEEIADRIDARFQLLTGGGRTALPRHRTLEATLDWSFGLLAEPERTLFRRLSVFAGGFTLQAAERVASGDPIEPSDVLDLLAHLVDKSLVIVQPREGQETRYRLLETTRHYGKRRLVEAGEAARRRDSLLKWTLSLGEEAAPQLDGPDQPAWLARLDLEHDNLRNALAWALDGGSPIAGLRLAAAVFRFWFLRSHFREGQEWLERLLEAAGDAPGDVRARALYGAGLLATSQGDQPRALELLEDSLRLHRRLGDRGGTAWALHYLARAGWGVHDPELVGRRLEDSLRIFREGGNEQAVFLALVVLSLWEWQYEPSRALADAQEAYRRASEIASPRHRAHGAEVYALASLACDDVERAAELFTEALGFHREAGNRACSAHALENAVPLLVLGGKPVVAAELLGASERLRENFGAPVPPYERVGRDAAVAAVNSSLEEPELALARARGRDLTMDEALELAVRACRQLLASKLERRFA